MVKKILDKRNYIILFIIIILIIWILFSGKKEYYIKTFNYFDETITISIYDEIDYKKTTKNINNIYKKYNINLDSINKYEKSLIEYGIDIYKKSNGYIDITSGKLIENLKEEKEYNFKTKIDDIKIKNNKLVKKIDFNFDSIIGSFVTKEVINYLEENNIKKYIINENGDITVGEYYSKGKYALSINNPKTNEVLYIVNLENKSMATRNSEGFKSYMVNPKTNKIENKYDSVVVIANDNLTANMLVNTLYLMDEKEGKDFIKKYDAEALWIDDEIIKTNGFDKYIKK